MISIVYVFLFLFFSYQFVRTCKFIRNKKTDLERKVLPEFLSTFASAFEPWLADRQGRN
jgi:uncharacterized membrane protein